MLQKGVQRHQRNIKKCPLKKAFHPKKKILLSFTYPQAVLHLHTFHCSAEQKTKQFLDTIDFHSIFFSNNIEYGSQWGSTMVWLPSFFKTLSFLCSTEERNAYRFGTKGE